MIHFTPTSAVVRYQIPDVARALAFYTRTLGFKVELENPPAFAMVSRGQLTLLLSGPGSSGAQPMPDGRAQGPGGWNRIVLYVEDLAGEIDRLTRAGVKLETGVVRGTGGSQTLMLDPDGNAIELHEAPKR